MKKIELNFATLPDQSKQSVEVPVSETRVSVYAVVPLDGAVDVSGTNTEVSRPVMVEPAEVSITIDAEKNSIFRTDITLKPNITTVTTVVVSNVSTGQTCQLYLMSK